ncbi:MAG: hypothetical protein NTW50_03870 [Candidatus Berkelbacteria bacterium]|nr:hypothetical protein [Candidatus Berkelbacteria bacterium]
MSEIENLEHIRDFGMAEFVEKENEKWVSSEGVLCVHNQKHYQK